jgi:PAS domain S-box-containing protein
MMGFWNEGSELLAQALLPYKTLFDTHHQPMVLVSGEHVIIHANQSFANLIGFDSQHLFGKRFDAVLADESMFLKHKEVVDNCLQSHHASSVHAISFVRSDGEQLDCQVMTHRLMGIESFFCTTILDSVNEPVRHALCEECCMLLRTSNTEQDAAWPVAENVDVSENSKRQSWDRISEKLMRTEQMASLGFMTSGLTHEITAPNNLIVCNTYLLKTYWEALSQALADVDFQKLQIARHGLEIDDVMQEIGELIDGIAQGTDRIQRITQNLRTFIKGDDSLKEPLDVAHLVDAATLITSHMIKVTAGKVIPAFDDDLPTVCGNFQKLEQVLVNLITNACQALESEDGNVGIRVFVRSPSQLCIEVWDTGVGIPDEHLDKVTDPFFSTKSKNMGTGLGLSVSETIMRDHSGKLEIESKVGKGTIARMILPIMA